MSLSLGAVADAVGESPAAALDPSRGAALDLSPRGVGDRLCGWCRSPLEQTAILWCGKKCRQAAWRLRKLNRVEDVAAVPKRLAYADPPYPGMSRKYYSDEPTYAGEVDHPKLVQSLMEGYDGWALSTSAKALRDILPLCPPEAIVCPWVKPNGVSSKTRGAHNTWEPVVVVPARRRRPGFRDWLSAKPARGGGTLPGRKPIAFCAWLFKLLGALPCDSLDDLFPGTGVVSASFAELQRAVTR